MHRAFLTHRALPRLSALACATLLICSLSHPAAHAAPVDIDLPAQPLPEAIKALARSAGITIAADSALLAGKTAPAVRGRFEAAQVLQRMLAGSGLEAVPQGQAGWLLRKAQAPTVRDGITLSEVTVEAAVDRSAPTEGTGSYTTSAMNTATRLGLSIRETPQSVSVITRQQMEDQGLTSIEGVLERSVGVSQNKWESDRGDFSARGFTISKIQIDGLASYASNSFDSDAFSDTALYDRVEIVRGATGLMAGAGDPSATVNLVRKRPTRQFQGHAQISAGRWDTRRAEVDLSGPLAMEGKVRGRLVTSFSDGKSFMENYRKDSTAVYGIIEAQLPADVLLSVGIDYRKSHVNGATWSPPVPLFYADGSRTRLSRATSTGAPWAYIDTEGTSSFASMEKLFENGWNVKFQLTDRDAKALPKHMAGWGFPDRLTGAGTEIDFQLSDSRRTQQGADLHAAGPFNLFGRQHELITGFASNRSRTDTEWLFRDYGAALGSFYNRHSFPEPFAGRGASKQRYEQRENAAYLASRWNVADPLKVVLGLRLTTASQEILCGTSRTYARYRNELTPYAGVVYDLSRHYSAYASYTDIFKTQTARDRSGALLDPIVGQNYETGLKGEFYGGRLTVSAAAFKVKQDNLASFDAIIDGEYRYKPINGATVKGYELEASGELTPQWNISAGFTHRKMKNGQENYLETTQPEKLLRLSSSYRLPGALSKLTLGGHVTWQSRIYEKGTGPGGINAVQDAYALLHLFASYHATDRLSLQMNVNNVFDKTYLSGILGGYGRYGDPRNLQVSMKYRF